MFVPAHRYGQEFAATMAQVTKWDLSRRSVLDTPLASFPIAIHDHCAIHAIRPWSR